MNHTERLNLKNLINNMECENNTDNIRKLKHSVLIRNDIRCLERLKKDKSALKRSNLDEFTELCKSESSFLYNNYTDIFNKVLKDEIDLRIMTKLLMILKMIEDGNVDQHEGSVMVGKILKELYIDSAMKRADNIDKEHEAERIPPVEGKSISWKDYKKMNIE
jgi:hypothetical protein